MMQFLQKLAAGQDVIPAHNAVLRQPELWQGEKIVLRKAGVNWFAFDLLPQLRPFIFGLMARIDGEVLGDVMVFRVAAGDSLRLAPTSDQIYLLPLHLAPGVLLQNAGEQVMLLPGDFWWTGPGTSLTNNSAEELVLLVVLATPNAPATFAPAP